MPEHVLKVVLCAAIVFFSVFFAWVVIPPLIENPDVWGAFAAGFVNPYSTGYSTDVIVCWFILAAWVWHEAKVHKVRHGWICLLLGVVPGVAVGFALYLLVRAKQLKTFAQQA
ncbi:MAG TPA: DUF2834 domain-containing protein [Limnobacter sp.]|nr:DUF2834 domain-containing protein [Limnobacter sp.]